MISTIDSYFLGLVTPGAGSFAADLLIGGAGFVVGGHTYPTAADVSGAGITLTNEGEIIGGAALGAGAVILNQGTIYDVQTGAGQFGISASSFGTIINTGGISGNQAAIDLAAGGVIANAGQLGAVLDTGALSLLVEHGAVFSGPVTDTSGTGQLTLAGNGALALDGTDSFSGFSAISFAPGAGWTLEGNIADFAAGQSISGFALGDSLILDGFSASSFVATGISLVLANPTARATLSLNALPQNRTFAIATYGGNTTIFAEDVIVSTITTTLTAQVRPGISNYTADLTITAAGEVDTGSLSSAVYSDWPSAFLANYGQIITQGSQFAAVNFSGVGTVVNAGRISAGAFAVNAEQVTNAGTLSGGVDGVYIFNGPVANTGGIWGGNVGVELAGAGFGQVVNSGSIGGGIGISFSNAGMLTNSGTISGTSDAVRAYGPLTLAVNPGAAFNGAVEDMAGNGVLVLQGNTAGMLDLGKSFSGFYAIDFAPGSTWTLEEDNFAVTGSHQINGFVNGDTLILNGYTATPQSFVTGTTGATGYIYSVAIYVPAYGVHYIAKDHPGGVGGDGLRVGAGSLVTNSNIVIGGTGGTGASSGYAPPPGVFRYFVANGGPGGTGGVGARVTGGILLNDGYIGGGPGGVGGLAEHQNRSFRSGGTGTNGAGLNLIFGTVINHGFIGGTIGAIISNGVLADYGTIAGLGSASAYAVSFAPGAATLEVGASAAFIGDVIANPTDTLLLTGAAMATASIGSEFQNFGAISLAAGAAWTLEGDSMALAAGQSITGFLPGDTLILDGFSASSYTFAAGTGLTLSNATASATLALNALPGNTDFVIKTSAAGTTIAPVETILNTGTLTGAAGQNGGSYFRYPGTPGEFGGVAPSFPVGIRGGRGGDGFDLTAGTFAINTGIILGAVGGYGGVGEPTANSGDGGAGVSAPGGTLFNAGTIQGGAGGHGTNGQMFFSIWFTGGGNGGNGGAGVYLAQGATVTNAGVILGGAAGAGGAAYVIDSETFAAGNAGAGGLGVSLQNGTLINAGTIAGNGGVEITNGVLIDSGSIASTGGNPAIGFGYGSGTLVLYPNAVFTGDVVADATGTDVLDLAGSGRTGTEFQNFGTINFEADASWSLALNAPAFGSTETISGLSAADTLAISHLQGAGTVELAGFAATASSYVPGTGLVLSNATASETLVVSGSYSSASFTVTENPDGGTDVSVACFCRGTRIATPRGNMAIEKLRIGDLVNTMFGPRRIRWIGQRAYAARFLALGGRPIRIRRHAIAFNVPSRDLYVSPDHAIAEGGVLIHAHLLINGVSITQPEISGDVEYFHLELDAHSVIFAENLATESFIDEGARHRFANAHTAPASAPQKPCLPRVFDGFHLHNIKTRIARRAGVPEPVMLGALRGCIDESTPNLVRGWAQDSANPEAPVLLEIFSGDLRHPKTPEIFSILVLANAYRPDLREAGLGSGCHGFAMTLPGPVLAVRRAADGATLPEPPVMPLARAK